MYSLPIQLRLRNCNHLGALSAKIRLFQNCFSCTLSYPEGDFSYWLWKPENMSNGRARQIRRLGVETLEQSSKRIIKDNKTRFAYVFVVEQHDFFGVMGRYYEQFLHELKTSQAA